ncbi:HIT family protein [Halobacillus salinus]|uniref:HIT family protein n=1 Tax=Halobacillus salinus TaxID=192814 RepID=UPI0009A8FE43|nr:HIT family protein [Halobacillus salinus]
MTNCAICKKHRDQDASILYQNDIWAVSVGPYSSQVPGYLYLEPVAHVENWAELSDEAFAQAGVLLKRIESCLKEQGLAERLYMVTISEAVRHLHIHLIPRSKGNDLKGLQLIGQATLQENELSRISKRDFDKVVDKIKSDLQH